MTTSLPPYSGNTMCPKCNAAVGTAWHPGLPYPPENSRGDRWACWLEGVPAEHMCRMCRCGYGWVEATADAGEATPGLHALPGGAER